MTVWFSILRQKYYVFDGGLARTFNSYCDVKAYNDARASVMQDKYLFKVMWKDHLFCLTIDREYAMRLAKRKDFAALPILTLIKGKNNDVLR